MATPFAPTERACAPYLVLVADADTESRHVFAAIFDALRCEVVEAVDGREALVNALCRLPSLVVTELRLPFIDGVALCEILRRDRATAGVPIAVVTADARPAEAERALAAGADAVLTKPTRFETLITECERLLHRSLALCRRGTAAVAGAAAPIERDRLAAAKRRVILARAHRRGMTTTPPLPPPLLTCPACDTPLRYEYSFVGGVSARFAEQWDYFTCPCSGVLQYRQRTRKLKRVEQPA